MISYNALLAQVPTIEILEQGRKTSIRGLSVVNNNVDWVSGSGGSVGKSLDGGKTWNWITVAGYEKSDFRDIEAFDDKTALIMGITQPAVILKTKDGGLSWRKVFEDTAKAAFFDAMNFVTHRQGFVVGDPILNNSFYGLITKDGGETWQKDNEGFKVDTLFAGEAFFASSGTNLAYIDNTKMMAVTGGKKSRLITSFSNPMEIPIIQGQTSTGANSIAVYKNKGIIVGGDFGKDTARFNNAVLVSFAKNNIQFSSPKLPPHGYRSCVIYIDENNLIACGTSGVDISKDGGISWENISKESFHVVQKAKGKNGDIIYLAGSKGRIAKLITQ
jgi:Photosynthesis system II assembly factor YCF48